jgi:hypothetical protein
MAQFPELRLWKYSASCEMWLTLSLQKKIPVAVLKLPGIMFLIFQMSILLFEEILIIEAVPLRPQFQDIK